MADWNQQLLSEPVSLPGPSLTASPELGAERDQNYDYSGRRFQAAGSTEAMRLDFLALAERTRGSSITQIIQIPLVMHTLISKPVRARMCVCLLVSVSVGGCVGVCVGV